MTKQIIQTTLLTFSFIGGIAATPVTANTELPTQSQAIARVRTILRNNTGRCRINKINSVTAVRVKAGWRVTARLVMSASGRAIAEKATWIVNDNGASPQDQLTAEIAVGCLN